MTRYNRSSTGRSHRDHRALAEVAQSSLLCGGVFLLLFALPGRSAGQDSADARSDDAARIRLFAEQHVDDSASRICELASRLKPEPRWQFLIDWVMPPSGAPSFRLQPGYAAAGSQTGPDSQKDDHARIVSPALDLIQLAGATDRTDKLRSAIDTRRTDTVPSQCHRHLMLAMIDMAEQRLDAATEHFEKAIDLALREREHLDSVRDALLVAFDNAASEPALMAVIHEPAVVIRDIYRTDFKRTVWHRHFDATVARLDRHADESSSDDPASASKTQSQWFAASRETAFEHGSGFPKPDWHFTPGSVRKLSGYADDFLFFQSPLQGDYTIEGIATGFGYREAQLLSGGQWNGLVYTHQHVAQGDVRGEQRRLVLDPPMTPTHNYGLIRTRIVNRQDTSITYFNGREIHQRSRSSREYPWTAIRVKHRSYGGFDDLSITGQPTIPDAVSMVASETLPGWYDYYASPPDGPHTLTAWMAMVTTDDKGRVSTEITAPRDPSLPVGSHHEQLLRYLRPITVDGVIDYQFWYEPGQYHAHPAIGRQCFLIESDAVFLHQLTDGIFERRGLRPDHRAPIKRAASAAIPLRPHAWNSIRLERQGDRISLVLNGQTVVDQYPIDRGSQPSFGLFYYDDQTALRVRNLRWQGDWPKALPDVNSQQLRAAWVDKLAWEDQRPSQEFHHVFDESFRQQGQFSVVTGNSLSNLSPTEDGLVMNMTSDGGYRGVLVAPRVSVRGNFDITLTYDDFECRAQETRVGSMRLQINAATTASDVVLMQRLLSREHEPGVQCLRMSQRNGRDRRHYFGLHPSDTDAGRLRISRRGKRAYFLAADNDSEQFRLVGEDEFVADDLAQLGIQAGIQIEGPGGQTTGRLRELHIRAEQISGTEALDPNAKLTAFNQHAQKLRTTFEHDFAASEPDPEELYRWTDGRPWQESDAGLPIRAPGTDHWSSAGVAVTRMFVGDFDIQFEFDQVDLATPPPSGKSQVLLQLEFRDPDSTQINCMLTRAEDGRQFCESQMRVRGNGAYTYLPLGSIAFADPDYLRFIRRGDEALWIAGQHKPRQEVVVAAAQVPTAATDVNGVKMMLHTAGEGRESTALFKRIMARSDGVATMSNFNSPAPLPKSPAERLLDTFRNLIP